MSNHEFDPMRLWGEPGMVRAKDSYGNTAVSHWDWAAADRARCTRTNRSGEWGRWIRDDFLSGGPMHRWVKVTIVSQELVWVEEAMPSKDEVQKEQEQEMEDFKEFMESFPAATLEVAENGEYILHTGVQKPVEEGTMTLKDIQDELSHALQSDLERGVAWMNEEASAQWAREYPALNEAIGKILDLDTEGFLDLQEYKPMEY